jgi:hypothetical protein
MALSGRRNDKMLKYFLSGGLTLGYFVVALFFFRFWNSIGDKLFLFFALAFTILGIERVLFVSMSPTSEMTPYVYVLRLIAYLMIWWAIIEKNSGRTPHAG